MPFVDDKPVEMCTAHGQSIALLSPLGLCTDGLPMLLPLMVSWTSSKSKHGRRVS